MINDQQELLYDLLTAKAVFGLDSEDEARLAELAFEGIDEEFASLEMTVAALSIAGCDIDEPMPAHLRKKILNAYGPASAYTADENTVDSRPMSETSTSLRDTSAAAAEPVSGSWFGWLGWVAAAAAGIALAFNVFSPPTRVIDVASNNGSPQPTAQQRELTTAEKRDRMLASGVAIVKATWGLGNVKGIKEVVGDVVWSDVEQAGYMRLQGLPVNDKNVEQYQLWIFEDGKLEPHPKDGGVFDITAEGEVIVPIDAKLMTKAPKVFAITIESPGGVVVSTREKIAALAKAES